MDCPRTQVTEAGASIYQILSRWTIQWYSNQFKYILLHTITLIAHRAMTDVTAAVQLFTTTTLQPVLPELITRSKGYIVSTWKRNHVAWFSSKEIITAIAKCTKTMAHRLKEAHFTYNSLQLTFDSCNTFEEFDVILKASPRIMKWWHLDLWDHFSGKTMKWTLSLFPDSNGYFKSHQSLLNVHQQRTVQVVLLLVVLHRVYINNQYSWSRNKKQLQHICGCLNYDLFLLKLKLLYQFLPNSPDNFTRVTWVFVLQ